MTCISRANQRFDLTDAQWATLQPLLPPEKPPTGRPNHDHRRILNGILWVHRTGAPWRDLPAERYGPVGTVSSRFYRWRQAGVWTQIWTTLQTAAEACGAIDWTLHFVDATIVRAHQHAAGARWVGEKEGTSPQERAAAEALGRSQGGFSTKIHLRAEGQGRPMAITLTGGERHEQTALVEILDAGAVRRPGPGRPRLRPRRLVGDKAYAGRPVRTHLRRRGIQPVIPSKTGQPRNPFFDRQAYRLRNRVERLINRLKQFRRIATRYEKRAVNDLAMIVIGAILLWL